MASVEKERRLYDNMAFHIPFRPLSRCGFGHTSVHGPPASSSTWTITTTPGAPILPHRTPGVFLTSTVILPTLFKPSTRPGPTVITAPAPTSGVLSREGSAGVEVHSPACPAAADPPSPSLPAWPGPGPPAGDPGGLPLQLAPPRGCLGPHPWPEQYG